VWRAQALKKNKEELANSGYAPGYAGSIAGGLRRNSHRLIFLWLTLES